MAFSHLEQRLLLEALATLGSQDDRAPCHEQGEGRAEQA